MVAPPAAGAGGALLRSLLRRALHRARPPCPAPNPARPACFAATSTPTAAARRAPIRIASPASAPPLHCGRLLVDVDRAVALDDVGGALDFGLVGGGQGQHMVAARDGVGIFLHVFAVIGAEHGAQEVLDAVDDAAAMSRCRGLGAAQASARRSDRLRSGGSAGAKIRTDTSSSMADWASPRLSKTAISVRCMMVPPNCFRSPNSGVRCFVKTFDGDYVRQRTSPSTTGLRRIPDQVAGSLENTATPTVKSTANRRRLAHH